MIYIVFSLFFALVLFIGNAAASIFLGIIFALIIKPDQSFVSLKIGTTPLQIGIVILGATISLPYAWSVSANYLPWISLFVLGSFFTGLVLGKILGIHHRIAFLLSAGAAICGGTAIAAVAPIIKAKPQELLIAMTIVFLLNALAIIFFPIIGGYLEMTNFQFGAWSALAIHDTSSVIGSALTYSNESAQVAATLKLGRTIWIIPLILITNWAINRQAETTKFPRFILFFILAIVLNTALNFDDQVLDVLKIASQVFLMLGLFCIGTQFKVQELKSISGKPLVLALILWIMVIPSAYWLVTYF
ncbi:putative sulfate exporter family transporter [Gammaproteobacteria bacterium]|nr:putative sulfate exporter family transporter [Gammaproteobacteria bacterium]MDB4243387.1 putative sulfate exporter family transporter [Gammaproteobacteria bacterium]MDB9907557.1 putative sulfate exporter family transporter [Gammaproteobacteria bacterium]MDC1387543.1 putative sulfate exporter family transporter [Gammaproteobacteria bacterium]